MQSINELMNAVYEDCKREWLVYFRDAQCLRLWDRAIPLQSLYSSTQRILHNVCQLSELSDEEVLATINIWDDIFSHLESTVGNENVIHEEWLQLMSNVPSECFGYTTFSRNLADLLLHAIFIALGMFGGIEY